MLARATLRHWAAQQGRKDAMTLWQEWDDQTESYFADDPDTFCCVFENPVADGSEVGQGAGLSSTDRTVATLGAGALPGATGTPPRRSLDGEYDLFRPSASFLNTMIGGSNVWTIGMKCYGRRSGDSSSYLWHFANSADSTEKIVMRNTSGHIIAYVIRNGSAYQVTTETSMDLTSNCWCMMWCDGVTLRAGQSRVFPTKWSDFDSIRRGSRSFSLPLYTNYALRGVFGDWYGSSSACFGTEAYWFVVSRACLIDNTA